MKPGRFQVLLYLLTAVALVVSLAMLLYLRQSYEHARSRSLDDMKRFFTRDEALRPPHDIENFRFEKVETLARQFEGALFVKRLYVTKMIEGRGEWPVHPFYLPALQPDWRKKVKGWTRLALTHNGETYGALYVEEDPTAMRSVHGTIAVLGALLLVTLGALTGRLVFQQSELRGAHVALAEKDRQMIRLERLALAGQLSANILHDLKKPVANIKQNLADLEMLLRDLAGGSPIVRKIKEQTELFFAIIRDLRLERFVGAEDSRREYVDVNEQLRRSCALVQYERQSIIVDWELSHGALIALAPPYQLIQVFSNIILNAYQAMGKQGTLTIESREQEGRAVIRVTDTGPGVPPSMRARLFDPFETSKPEDEGTGLGLYISRNIIEELGGAIRLDEAPDGVGACFVIELPLAAGDEVERH